MESEILCWDGNDYFNNWSLSMHFRSFGIYCKCLIFSQIFKAVKTTFLSVIYVENQTTNVAWCLIQLKLCKNNFCPSTVIFRHFSLINALCANHNYAHISWSTGNFVDLMRNSDSAWKMRFSWTFWVSKTEKYIKR
jgi:hypothetical protein